MADDVGTMGKGLVEGMVDALSDKHSQLDIRFQNLTLTLGGMGLHVQLSGTVTLSVHLRDLADEERAAHIQHNVAALRT
jgi:hypothetical protein